MPFDERLKADIQLEMYDKCMGDFGSKIAMHSRKIRSPGSFFFSYKCYFCLLFYYCFSYGCSLLHYMSCLFSFSASWWERFGEQTPELTKFAIRVLSLTCSASGCERNWSTFQSVKLFVNCYLTFQLYNMLMFLISMFFITFRFTQKKGIDLSTKG